jgi:integrase
LVYLIAGHVYKMFKLAFLDTQSEEEVCGRQKIEEYKSCQIWLEGYNSQSTKKAYKIHLSVFCRYHNTDPDSLVKLKPEQIKIMVLNYVIHLKKVAKPSSGKARTGELSVNSVKAYLAGIQSFFESNDIVLNWKRIAKYYPEQVTNNLRAYTKEEISKLLSLADLRDRCLILLMVSTGMRVGAIKSLKLKHITRLRHESNIGLVSVYPESKDHRYNALMTYECMAAIDQYIDYRRKQHEKITAESYIIRDKFATFSKSTNRPNPITENTINKQMKFLLKKAGLPYDQLQPDHSFRKFFNTCLMNSNVAYSFKELLMGHSVKLDDVYYDKDSETSRQKIIVEYMKALESLTISEEYTLKKKIIEYEDKLKDAPKIRELESHLAAKIIDQDALKKQVELLQLEKQNETQAMQEKYEQDINTVREEMNQKFTHIISLIQQNPILAQIKPAALIEKSIK